jgi:hypothetical protein
MDGSLPRTLGGNGATARLVQGMMISATRSLAEYQFDTA